MIKCSLSTDAKPVLLDNLLKSRKLSLRCSTLRFPQCCTVQTLHSSPYFKLFYIRKYYTTAMQSNPVHPIKMHYVEFYCIHLKTKYRGKLCLNAPFLLPLYFIISEALTLRKIILLHYNVVKGSLKELRSQNRLRACRVFRYHRTYCRHRNGYIPLESYKDPL